MEITEALLELKNYYPVSATDDRTTLVAKMLELIHEKTNDFTEADQLITEPVDLKSILEKEGIKPAEWQQAKGSIERSEIDTVMWLASNIGRILNPSSDEGQEDREREAQALMLKLRLLKLKRKKNDNI